MRRSSRRCCTRRRCIRRSATRSSCSTQALRRGAGIAFVTEESLGGPALEALADLGRAPAAVVGLSVHRAASRAASAAGRARRAARSPKLGNVVLLERPLNADTLVSAARSALRGRDRQYQTRRHLIEQEEARIAERIANAEASRANEALEVAVDAGELGTFHCPWPLRAIEWNAKCKEHFWLPPDAEVDFDLFYSLVHDDDRESVRAAIDAAVDGARRSTTSSTAPSRPTAAERWIRAKGRVYRDERRASRPASTASRSTSAARSSSRTSARRCSRPSARRASRPSGRAA